MDHTEHPGQPQRPPASAQLSINSIDRYSNSVTPVAQYALSQQAGAGNNTAANFQISLQRPLLSGYFTRLAVSQVQLAWSVPTIVTGVNDQLTIFDVSNATTTTITVTQGFYTLPTLAAAIQNAFQTVFGAGTVVPSPTTYGLTFATNGGGQFRFVSQNQPARVLNLYNMLGIVYINTSLSLSTQITGPTRLIYTSYIDIISTKLTQYMRVKDSETSQQPDTSVLCRVYMCPPNQRVAIDASGNLPGSAPFTLVWDPNTPKHVKWEPNQYIYDFDIQVKDEFGSLVPWTAKGPFEFQMTLLASET